MIHYTTGDILSDDAEALVNTVNTVGVMGKGIALQFKRRFPGNYESYRQACDRKQVEPGRMHVWPNDKLEHPRFVINFPTKRHWKGKSRLEDIEVGLRDLRQVLVDRNISSVAVPPLGAGNGGLRWSSVRPLIDRYLHDLKDVDVTVYEPAGAPPPGAMPPHPRTAQLTVHRAAMVALFGRYLQPGFTLGRLEAQKLLYFLKVAGAPYHRLRFTKGQYGPYSEGINHVLDQVEGHFVAGFGDADARSAMRLLEGAAEAADALLAKDEHAVFHGAVERVADLIAGFDDAFGLELLASVHWVAAHDDPPARNASEAALHVHQWSDRKRQRYDIAQVRAAWDRLAAAGLVSASVPEAGSMATAKRDRTPPSPRGDVLASAL